MKNLLLILLISFCSYSQDTIVIQQSYGGYKKVIVNGKTDTLELSLFPNGKVLSRMKANPGKSPYLETRFYQNGKKMWERTLLEHIPQGPTVFYDITGKNILTINFKSGIAVDTLVHNPKYMVVFGNSSFHSIVYGGAENEDGSSNVSEMGGPSMYQSLKVVSYPASGSGIKSKSHPVLTDGNGNFMICLEKKKMDYGVFPSDYPLEKITPGLLCPETYMWSSGNDSWSISNPIKSDIKINYLYTEIKTNSVGYAP